MKGEIAVMNAPLVWKMKKFPFTAAFSAAVVMSVQMFPFFYFFWCIPDDLWIGAQQDIVSPPLQLFSAGGIYDFIIFPVI